MPSRSAHRAAIAILALMTALAGCAGPGGHRGGSSFYRSGDYAPPGPPEDPWRPYIKEAAGRFGVPEQWIRAVMRQESGGRADAESSAGAMGLMQVIPSTYATLRARYGLGSDPFQPHDNIMAGTAYIREMYDRFGAPGFLAAYNAGPDRLDSYLATGNPLPDETVEYLSNIAPRLGPGTPLSGPLAVYAGGGGDGGAAPHMAPSLAPPVVFARASVGSCDPDAAFDPDHPCTPTTAVVAPRPAPVVMASSIYVPRPPAAAAPPPVFRPPPRRDVEFASLSVAPAAGGWAIQVGAFLDPAVARAAASSARRAAPDLLADAAIDLPRTTPFGGAVLYRARLDSLSPGSAANACARLSARGDACITVPPGR